MVKANITSFLTKYSLYIIFALYILSVTWRIVGTNNYMFPYWFDPARDAILSREIIEDKDIKIQGPSASGTNDTVFHGVLYYYIVGPLYTVFHGDPQMVLRVVILLSGLALFPVYGLSKSLLKPLPALLATAFYAFSYDVFRSATWLSNPVIAVVGIPLFFYFLWRVFFEDRVTEFPLLMLALAVCHQAVILFAPWWLIVGICFAWHWRDSNKRRMWSVKPLVMGAVVYLIGVSTMILAQLRVLQAGVFSVSKLAEFNGSQSSEIITIWYTFQLMVSKYVETLFPTQPVLAALVIIAIIFYFSKQESKKKWFLLLMATSPLWLLSWHYRNMYHSFIGLEVCTYIGLAGLITWFWQKRWQVVSVALILIFIVNQHFIYKKEVGQRMSLYYVPQGAYLREMLDAIDYTYKTANYGPFTISTITNPYGYNTTWAYLYGWYGQKKYGYTPQYVGPDQSGIFGGDLLARSLTPARVHFSIKEPNNGMPSHLYGWFDQDQQSVAGTPSAKLEFGTILVDVHQNSTK